MGADPTVSRCAAATFPGEKGRRRVGAWRWRHCMIVPVLIGAALLDPVASEAVQSVPPERIELPVIQPGCDRAGDEDTVVVCGRNDRRFRIDPATLSAVRAIERKNDHGNHMRPLAIIGGCSETGPMGCRGEGVIPVSMMAFKALGLIATAIRGEDLRPALRQGPTDYEIYQRAKAEAETKEP